MTGLGWVRNADERHLINRENVLGMVQQQALAKGPRVYNQECRRRRRQLGGAIQTPIVAQTCLSDLSGPSLTRGTRW